MQHKLFLISLLFLSGLFTASAQEEAPRGHCALCGQQFGTLAPESHPLRVKARADMKDWNPTNVIDLCIAFNHDGRDIAIEEQGSIENYAEKVVQSMNEVFFNSGLDCKYRLAGTMVIDAKLTSVAQGPSVCYNSAELREEVKRLQADITILFVQCSGLDGVSGNAFYCAEPGFGYACCQTRGTCRTLTPAHEAGHVIGCGHSRDVDIEESHEYAVGATRFDDKGQQYSTVMGYNGILIPYFSSPDTYYNGLQMGSATEDNCRRIRERLPEVLRLGEPRYTYELGQYEWFPDQYEQTLSVSLSGQKAYRITPDCDWITVNPSMGYLEEPFTIQVKYNDTGRPRTGHVTVSDYDKGNPEYTRDDILGDAVVTVTQLAEGTVAILPEEWDAPAGGGTQDVRFVTGTHFTISGAPEWLTLNTSEAYGNTTVKVTAAPNTASTSRTATLTVASGYDGFTTKFVVRQDGQGVAPFSVDATSLKADSKAQTFTVNLTASTAFTASVSDASWLAVTPGKGTGNTPLTISVSENKGKARTGTVTVSAVNGSVSPITITVSQEANGDDRPTSELYQLDFGQWQPDSKAQSTTVGLTTTSAYYTKTSASWLTVSPAKGEGSAKLTLSVTANTSPKERTATLTVVNEKGTDSVQLTVTQQGKPDGIEAPATLDESTRQGKLYDLQGRVITPGVPSKGNGGVFILNGRKVIR